MGRIIEYTLVSADGVFSTPQIGSFMAYRDEAYFRDGQDVLMASEAMLYGRKTYEDFAKIWPGRDHPWAKRLNGIKKYVFSSTLESAEWGDSTIVRGDVVDEARRLKQGSTGDLLIFGHTQLAVALMRAGLVDLLDLSVHPVFLGAGEMLLHDGLATSLRLVATKTFSKIVKLSYAIGPEEPR